MTKNQMIIIGASMCTGTAIVGLMLSPSDIAPYFIIGTMYYLIRGAIDRQNNGAT